MTWLRLHSTQFLHTVTLFLLASSAGATERSGEIPVPAHVYWWLAILAVSLAGVGIFTIVLRRRTLVKAEELQAANLRLEESEIQFRELLQKAPISIAVYDSQGVVQYLNDRFVETFGYTMEDIPTLDTWWLHVCSDEKDRREVTTLWRKLIRDAEQKQSDIPPHRFLLTCKDGESRHVEVSGTTLGSRRLVLLNDVNDRIIAEMELHQSNERLRAVLDSLDSVVYVADMESYRILFLNRRGRETWGDVTGGICWNSLQAGQTGPCPFCTNPRLLTREGLPDRPVVWEFHNTRNGRWYECRDQAIRWSDGRLVRMEIATDITERKQADDVLFDMTQRLELATISGGLGVWDWSIGTDTLIWDERMLELYGIRREDFTGSLEGWIACLHPDDRELARAACEAALPGSDLDATFRVLSGDGSVTYLKVDGHVLRERDGTASRIIGITRDITPQKLTEEALEKRLIALTSPLTSCGEIRFQDLFNVAEIQKIQDAFAEATGVASIITYPDGTPITEPSNFCHLCKNIIRATEKGSSNCFRSDAVIGRLNPSGPTIRHCLSGGLWDGGASIQVGERHVANWLVGQVLDQSCDPELMIAYAGEIGADEESYREALAHVTRMSKAQFENVCQALFLIAGQLSRLAFQNVQQARFITERRQSEEAMAAAEAKFRGLLESVQLYAVMLDREGNITFCNDYFLAMTGWSHDEVIHSNWFQLFTAEEERDTEEGQFRISLVGDDSSSHESSIVTRVGRRRLIAWNNSLLRTPEGGVVGIASIGTDLTEQKRLEEQLRQSLKMESVGRLAGGVAHDFNNMLTVILGYTGMCTLQLPEDDPLRQVIQEIEKAANHSRDITRQLLAFSRQQIVSPRTVDLNAHLLETNKTLSRLIGEDINFRFIPGTDLGTIRIDPSQIDQILINLAVNARDAMPDGGDLIVETSTLSLDELSCLDYLEARPGEYVLMTVSDSGAGMDQETVSHIFEPFYTTKEVGKGTGLGLATVYGIVTQNNGFIKVYSEPEHGTVFLLFFPREYAPPPAPATAVPAMVSGSGSVLLVEDNHLVRTSVEMMLRIVGYEVLVASTPREALAICGDAANLIDLVLTDVIMPEMSGRELYENLLLLRPRIKILFMSGYTSDVITSKGILEEGWHFMQKPFDLEVLNEKIRTVISDD